jgi:outer membrane immunogenic protein
MKKFGLGVVAAAVLCAGACGVASAADLRVKAVAPPPAPVLAPTWTGFYIGGNVGSAWGQDDVSASIPGVATNLALTSQGLRNFIGGVQGGYNYQFGAIVLGIEADADWGDVKGTAPCVVVVSCQDRIKSFGDVGGRAGVVVDRALIYLKGGWAWADQQFNTSFAVAGLTGSNSVSTTRSGAFLGTGVEYAFMPNWSAKIEYDYYDFGTKNVSTSAAVAGLAIPISASSNLTEQVVKFGVNYKFWGY